MVAASTVSSNRGQDWDFICCFPQKTSGPLRFACHGLPWSIICLSLTMERQTATDRGNEPLVRRCLRVSFAIIGMCSEDPEPTILVLQSWPGMPSLQNQKLLAEA